MTVRSIQRIAAEPSFIIGDTLTASGLYGATRYGWPLIVEYLMELGADMTQALQTGQTPLTISACQVGALVDNVGVLAW